MIGNLSAAISGVFTPEPRVAIPLRLLADAVSEVFPNKTTLDRTDIVLAWTRAANMMFKLPNCEFHQTATTVWNFSLSMMNHSDEKYVHIPLSHWNKLVAVQPDFAKMTEVFAKIKDDPLYVGLKEDRARRVMAVFTKKFPKIMDGVIMPDMQAKTEKPVYRKIPMPTGIGAFPA